MTRAASIAAIATMATVRVVSDMVCQRLTVAIASCSSLSDG